jgi:hypothetical protein
LLVPIVFAAVTVGAEGHFTGTHLPAVLFHIPVMLFGAIVVAHIIGRREHVRMLLVAALLAWIVIDAISLAIWAALLQTPLPRVPVVNMGFFYGPIAWLALAVARFAITLGPTWGSRRFWVVAACALFLALPLGAVVRDRSLWSTDWTKRSTERRAERMAPASEETLYRQPELLENELAGVKPGTRGVIDVYLIGMAGYGSQDVFMHEVESVATLFRERFRAEDHIVMLVNNPKTALIYPIATVTSLKASIARVAQVMDPEEDVLVLFLTSHGSADHRFSIELWPLELKQITPAVVREILASSGIKNRVVIVSACYAGGFVPGLKDDNTLVIAAAAPDRNSFGCSNENEWTYFGKAYFDEALRRTFSFTRAFAIAKPIIEEREKKEGYDPSMPQMSEGPGIKAKLEELERQLSHALPERRPS